MYSVETIPDTDKVYRRVHKSYVVDGALTPGAFCEIQGGMSTDWERYATPNQARLLAKKPEMNVIVSFITGNLRNINLKVVHSPNENRRSHADVIGVGTKNRLLLLEMFVWEIRH
jgi:hypothetical protein